MLLAIVMYHHTLQVLPPLPPPQPMDLLQNAAINTTSQGEGLLEHPDQILRESAQLSQMHVSPGDRTLTTEPAGLEPYPEAQRLSGLRRTSHTLYEDITVHTVQQVSLASISTHYQQQCAEAGFKLWVQDQTPNRVRKMYTRSPADSNTPTQVLTVRLRQQDEQIHVLLWLRTHRD